MNEPLLEAERAFVAGLLDQAERLFDGVARQDPGNSIAIVGLARVALERGDELHALELARRAQAIDPDNAAARRMADRIVEVRTFRGDETPAPAPVGPGRRSLADRLRRRP
jgi:hypothetical protein